MRFAVALSVSVGVAFHAASPAVATGRQQPSYTWVLLAGGDNATYLFGSPAPAAMLPLRTVNKMLVRDQDAGRAPNGVSSFKRRR